MNVLGLGLQIAGLLVAAAALLAELRASRTVPTPDLPDVQQLLRERNPWSGVWAHEISSATRAMPRGADQNYPLQRIGKLVKDDRDKARVAWDRQTKLGAQLYASNQALLESYLEEISGVHAATRRRVTIEMMGLLMTLVGTVVGSLA